MYIFKQSKKNAVTQCDYDLSVKSILIYFDMSLEELRDFDKEDQELCFCVFLDRRLKTLICCIKVAHIVRSCCFIQINNELVV